MPYGNLFSPLCRFFPSSYFMNRVENIGGVITIAARITDANCDILQDYKSPLMLESFTRNEMGLNCAFTVFTLISVHRTTPR